MTSSFDIIVVGGGHAGCEAAMAAANLGSSVLLISMDTLAYAKMSCNPAIGGIAKGQIVREIDALGGYTGIVTDRSSLQFRMLNRSKGPAMWSPRAQCDKIRFSLNWRDVLLSSYNLHIYEDSAVSFIFNGDKVCGVNTKDGSAFLAQAVIITAGTFLSGKLFIGRKQLIGGRIGESSALGITEDLVRRGVNTGRMKTGTPPRIDITSVDTSKLPIQSGDENPSKFSFSDEPSSVQNMKKQLICYILHTNSDVHDTLRTGFSDSPLFTGIIHGKGPRYCPSIEDKLRVFPDNDSHQLFLEPESLCSNEYYLQGFSSSLPFNIQMSALRKIRGLENVKVFRPAYAVEYDYFDPTQLKASLESRIVENLFFAGQVNGTTGYEEAAAQGLIAGINAVMKISGKQPLILGRDQSYIGVLIDDLITKGVDEPYRMFTSRAEYRILLRQDNADERLTPTGFSLGLVSEHRYRNTVDKYNSVGSLYSYSLTRKLRPDIINPYLESINSSTITESKKLIDIASRPEVNLYSLLSYLSVKRYSKDIIESTEIQIKYRGYIDREKSNAEKLHNLERLSIPDDFDYDSLSGLTIECRQKLNKYHPTTIAQASRISGVSPSDISVLLVYFGR